MQSRTDQLCSYCQRQLVPEAPQLCFFSPHPKNCFLKRAVVNALAMTKPTLFSTVTRPSWKQDQGGAIWLPLGLKEEISGSWDSLSPIITSPGGLLRPLFPQDNQLPKSRVTTPASLQCSGQKWGFSPIYKAAEALEEARGMAPATWKLQVSFRELGRKPECMPCKCSAHPRRWGASEQSKGEPGLLTKPSLLLCAFLLVRLDVGELIRWPQKGRQSLALPKGALSPIDTAPWEEKSGLLIIRLSTNIICLPWDKTHSTRNPKGDRFL